MTRAQAAVGLGALVAVGCLRSELPGLLKENWVGAVLVLSALASAALFRHVRSRGRTGEAVLFAVFPLALGALYLQPQRVASDGIFYFAPLRSLVVDFDLDFENEYRILGAESGYFLRTETGRLPNNYSIGPALLWLPAYLLAHALGLLGLYRPTGFGYPYFTAVATATAIGGFAGVVFVFRLLRSHFEESAALPATLLVWLATFHVWYMVFEPSMSHAFAMASVSGLLLLAQRGVRGARGYLLAGAASGIVALVRWQNVVFVPAALAVVLWKRERPSARDSDPRRPRVPARGLPSARLLEAPLRELSPRAAGRRLRRSGLASNRGGSLLVAAWAPELGARSLARSRGSSGIRPAGPRARRSARRLDPARPVCQRLGLRLVGGSFVRVEAVRWRSRVFRARARRID